MKKANQPTKMPATQAKTQKKPVKAPATLGAGLKQIQKKPAAQAKANSKPVAPKPMKQQAPQPKISQKLNEVQMPFFPYGFDLPMNEFGFDDRLMNDFAGLTGAEVAAANEFMNPWIRPSGGYTYDLDLPNVIAP